MISHGIVSSGLFSLVGILYEKVGRRRIFLIKGVISIIPCFAGFMFLLCVLNIGCPPSINLLGEIILYMGVFSWSMLNYIIGLCIVFLRALYSLYVYSSTHHGAKRFFLRGISLLNNLNKSVILFHVSPAFIFILLSNIIII